MVRLQLMYLALAAIAFVGRATLWGMCLEDRVDMVVQIFCMIIDKIREYNITRGKAMNKTVFRDRTQYLSLVCYIEILLKIFMKIEYAHYLAAE